MNNPINPIYVTQPHLPPLEEFVPYLEQIWANKWLTNAGPFHNELEVAIARHLDVPHLSLFTNGTIALVVALQALRISGEVITTPFTFVATTHSLLWNGIKPVFVDIDPATFNLDPNKIEAAIQSLPEHYRKIVLLRDVEEMTIDEIASTLALTRESVKARLHRARGLIREYLLA